jgi:hypothetical protein
MGRITSNILLLTTLTTAWAGPSLAADRAVNINATVGSVCEFQAVDANTNDPTAPITLSVGSSARHAGIAEPTGETTRTLHLSCNVPFVVHLSSEQGAVRRMSSANGGTGVDTPILGGGMSKAIAYTATPRLTDLDQENYVASYTSLIANSALQSGTTPSEPVGASNLVRTNAGGENSGGAYEGGLEIAISTEASQPLVAGFYRDTLTVILLAQ